MEWNNINIYDSFFFFFFILVKNEVDGAKKTLDEISTSNESKFNICMHEKGLFILHPSNCNPK